MVLQSGLIETQHENPFLYPMFTHPMSQVCYQWVQNRSILVQKRPSARSRPTGSTSSAYGQPLMNLVYAHLLMTNPCVAPSGCASIILEAKAQRSQCLCPPWKFFFSFLRCYKLQGSREHHQKPHELSLLPLLYPLSVSQFLDEEM